MATAQQPNVVLVVEDEPLIRAIAVDVLEEAGFDVLEAPTADYALLLLEKRQDIRVLVTDVDIADCCLCELAPLRSFLLAVGQP